MVRIGRYCRDLLQAARAGELDPAYCVESHISELLARLSRQDPPSLLLVGDSGVGKTQLLHGLAMSATRQTDSSPLLRGQLLSLNLPALFAKPHDAAAVVASILTMLKDKPDSVLVVDNFHQLFDTRHGPLQDSALAQALLPAITSRTLRCIATTTPDEYERLQHEAPALADSFEVYTVAPMSEEETIELLRQLTPALAVHHEVGISDKAIEESVRLTQQYLPKQYLPGKALTVLDQACACYKLKAMAQKSYPDLVEESSMLRMGAMVASHDVKKVITEITSVDIISQDAELWKSEMVSRLRNHVIGQDDAIEGIAMIMARMRTGMLRQDRPAGVILLAGPRGVGKTQTIRALAHQLFGTYDHFALFNLADYADVNSAKSFAEPARGGMLATAMKDAPFTIVLLSNVDSAHPDIYRALTPILRRGSLPLKDGRVLDFKRCLFVLSYNTSLPEDSAQLEYELRERLLRNMPAELVEEIRTIIPFRKLAFRDIHTIIQHFVRRLNRLLTPQGVQVEVDDAACTVLAMMGNCDAYGAGGLTRVMEQYVTTPIHAAINHGAFTPGTRLLVSLDSKGEIGIQERVPEAASKTILPEPA